jgi:hypothetical protein
VSERGGAERGMTLPPPFVQLAMRALETMFRNAYHRYVGTCIECGKTFVSEPHTPIGRQLFCSGRCRVRNWRKHNPTAYTLSRFQELQNYRLSRPAVARTETGCQHQRTTGLRADDSVYCFDCDTTFTADG